MQSQRFLQLRPMFVALCHHHDKTIMRVHAVHSIKIVYTIAAVSFVDCSYYVLYMSAVECLCCVDRTLHAGLDDLIRGAQVYVVDDPDRLVRAAAQGHLDVVRDVVRKHPCKVHICAAITCGHLGFKK